ncbi:MAG: hypothetical protein FWF37_00245 [Chloroflexi bacterium]|nr:hypothetical protein [Chloroflexota bacterium]
MNKYEYKVAGCFNIDKKAIIQEFVEFVEGRMSFDEFRHNYETNQDYQKLLDDKKPNEKDIYRRNDTINQSLYYYKWSTTLGRLGFQHYIIKYLQYYNVLVRPTMIYQDEHNLRVSIQPSYVNIDDEAFLKAIITSAPEELTKSEQKKWLKEKIKSLFVYDVKPPRWIQDPEWPIVNGKPLVFKSQTREHKDDERVWYTFYDPTTGEETTISQFY